MEEFEIVLENDGYQLAARGNKLILSTDRREEVFPIPSIQSILLRDPSAFRLGCIVFKTAQAVSGGVNLGFGVSKSFGAEKKFTFKDSDLGKAKRLRDYVVNYKVAGSTVGAIVSVTEEIRGLKALLDDGLLTQEEFDAKKKQLLGL